MLKLYFLALTLTAMMDAPTFAQDVTKCEPLEVKILARPSPPTNIWSLQELETAVIPEDADLAVLGDSIARQIYNGNQITNLMNSHSSFILAGGGDGFQHSTYRLNQFKKELTKTSPKKVVIVLGTNNYSSPACALETAFTRYLSEVRGYWPKAEIYVVPILPRGDTFALPDELSKYNEYLKENPDRLGYKLVNIDPTLLTCGIVRPNITTNLTLSPESTEKVDKICKTMSDSIEREQSGWDKSTKISCSIGLKLSCKQYRSDNIHLSNEGVSLLNSWIVATTGKFK